MECYQTGIRAHVRPVRGLPRVDRPGGGTALQGGARRDLAGTSGAHPSLPHRLHSGHQAGLRTGGRGSPKVPPAVSARLPSYLSVGDPQGRVPCTPFSGRREAPQALRPPRQAPSHCSRGEVPPARRPHGHAPRLRRDAGKTKTRGGARRRPAAARRTSAPTGWPACGPARGRRPPGQGSALPAGKLQKRTARVGQNPRAERGAPLPIPIHPARPVPTSLSLEEEFRRKGDSKSRCGEGTASLRRREQRAGRLGPSRPRAPGAPPRPAAIHHSGPLQCARGPATPAPRGPPPRARVSARPAGGGAAAGASGPGAGAGGAPPLRDPRGSPSVPRGGLPSARAAERPPLSRICLVNI